MDQPLVSVIVPVYKVEPYLHQCVDSIINQTFNNLEIILVDDGSPDECPKICDEYAISDPRIRVIHQENRGVSAARNTGLDKANGQLIMFVDSDDWLDLNIIKKLYNNMVISSSDVAVCGLWHCISESNRYPEIIRWKSNVDAGRNLIYGVLFSKSGDHGAVWHKLYRKECWEGLRFDPKMKLGEDTWVILQLLLKNNLWSLVEEPLYYYRYRKSGASHSSNYFFHSKTNYNMSKLYYSLLEMEPELKKIGVEYMVERFFIYINYAAKENEKADYMETRSDFLQYDSLIQQFFNDLSEKHRIRYQLIKHAPHILWVITRVRMVGVNTD